MTNDAQLPMMKNMLNSAMKSGIPMHLFHCYILDSHKEAAIYGSSQFNSITLKKLEVIKMNMGLDRDVLWVDNDIVFFEDCLNDIMSKRGNFVMQDDLWGACTGFFLARSNYFSLSVLQKSIDWLAKTTNKGVNDQHAFNRIYPQIVSIVVTKLSTEEYPNGEIYFNRNLTSKAKIVHCNYLTTTAEKVQRFKDHNLWDESDTAFLLTNRYLI
jgi:hypothetical protein